MFVCGIVFQWCYKMGLAVPLLCLTQQQCLSSSNCTHMDGVARPRAAVCRLIRNTPVVG